MNDLKTLINDLVKKGYSILDITEYLMYFHTQIQAVESFVFNLPEQVKSHLTFVDHPSIGFIPKKNGWSFRFDQNTEAIIKTTNLARNQYSDLVNRIKTIIDAITADIVRKTFAGYEIEDCIFEVNCINDLQEEIEDHVDPHTLTFCLDPFGKGLWLDKKEITYLPGQKSILCFTGEKIEQILPKAKPLLHGSLLPNGNTTANPRVGVNLYYDLAKKS